MLVRAACKIPTISSALLGETMVFVHRVLSVISLWLETIISLFPCCLPLRAVRLWYLLRTFSQAQRFWKFRKISQEAFSINTKRVYVRQVIFVIA